MLINIKYNIIILKKVIFQGFKFYSKKSVFIVVLSITIIISPTNIVSNFYIKLLLINHAGTIVPLQQL